MEAVKKNILPLVLFVGVIWVVEIVNGLLGHRLSVWGILPRHAEGLIGIPLAPFLHGGPGHAASNTLPLLIMGGLTLISGRARFWWLTAGIILLSGFLVWLFARESLHIGASGLVFGYFGALLAHAFFSRSILSIAIACVTMLLYGGILWGILPLQSHISFEGHFFGLVAGVTVAWLAHRFQRPAAKTLS